jgi:Ca-activated chloride channel family protein
MNPTNPVRVPTLVLLTAMSLPAQGLHPADGGPGTRLDGLRQCELQVRARVQDQVATTELRQIFANDRADVREAIWLLPLPSGATADGFSVTVNGQRMESEVLDAAAARQIYEQIVRRRQDPGLLEYAGHGCLRARVFPIPPRGEVQVEVRYRQVLEQSGGLHQWSFPLRAAQAAGQAPGRLALDLQIAAHQPIRTVYTPLAGVDIVRSSDHAARVSLELQGAVAGRDLDVFFGLEDRAFGLNLLTFRKGGEPGYFLMTLSPARERPASESVPRIVQLVVDTSGSMQGGKIEQARAALRYFVRSLRPDDWFNLVAFSTEARPLFTTVASAREADKIEQALAWIAALEARGGTNIGDALHAALHALVPAIAGKERVPLTVLVTDGMPTVGITDEATLVASTRDQNPMHQRVFVFGVGDDLNARLLDRIAEATRGSRDYVREGEDLEVKTAALFDRLSNPVMTDLEIACDGAAIERVHPKALPDLFAGDQLVLLGRYGKPGRHEVRLVGMLAGKRCEFVYESEFAAQDRRYDFVPPLWGERRVAALLDAVRLHGPDPELVDEVRRLGREFAIVTPYTGHLVLEDGAVVQARRARPGAGGPATGAGAGGPATPAPGGGGGHYRGPGDGLPPAVSGDDGFFLGAPPRVGDPALGVKRLLADLQRAGALPADAGESALQGMLARIGSELQAADSRLARLGEQASGKDAVDGSVYLARMLGGGRRDAVDPGGLAALLTRRVGEFSLRLLAGVWTDVAFTGETATKAVREVPAFADAYFGLLQAHPELAPVLAFSAHVLVVVDGEPIRIVAPPAK